ncbi:MAG: VOC family protein [Vicinamibacterales bacterium]|jgi:catechol 2,3-dioxygenase-like lactoylglutathione lyase family enzyme|nr:VOC family protein [Vicinamibacterales bacterium]
MKMMTLAPLSVLLVLAMAPMALAQLTAASQGPIVYGHHHLTVTSIEESKKFWVDTLGGEAATAGNLEFVKFPNVLVFMREAPPTGGTKGTTVNHLGFSVPSTRAMVEKVRAAGYSIVTRDELPPALAVENGLAHIADQDTYIGFAMSPDDVKVEFVEDRTQPKSIALHHVHFAGPVDEMKAWYVTTFGAAPGMRGSFQAADLPGVNLTYSASPETPAGTQGRALDHVGFEVENLEAFCRRLEAQGVTFDRPYGFVEDLKLGYAFFTDPFGTYIELTEGLDAY